MKPRVLVAMSGGVDSSVAAALLREQGYDVVGVAMRLAPEPATPIAKRRGTCCSHDDFEDARRVAERMDFPFYVIDLRADFAARVVDNFVSEYLGGRTPNPCVMCNREIKFDRLWSRARALNADFVATGHYARIEQGADRRFHLLRAADDAKDQSYFLFTLGQHELVAHDFSAWRDDQDPKFAHARARWASRPPTSPRARKSASCPTATMRASSSGAAIARNCAPARSSTATASVWRITPGCIDSPWDSAADWVSPAASGFTFARFAPSRAKSLPGAATNLNSSGLIANRVSLVDRFADRMAS